MMRLLKIFLILPLIVGASSLWGRFSYEPIGNGTFRVYQDKSLFIENPVYLEKAYDLYFIDAKGRLNGNELHVYSRVLTKTSPSLIVQGGWTEHGYEFIEVVDPRTVKTIFRKVFPDFRKVFPDGQRPEDLRAEVSSVPHRVMRVRFIGEDGSVVVLSGVKINGISQEPLFVGPRKSDNLLVQDIHLQIARVTEGFDAIAFRSWNHVEDARDVFAFLSTIATDIGLELKPEKLMTADSSDDEGHPDVLYHGISDLGLAIRSDEDELLRKILKASRKLEKVRARKLVNK